MIRIIPTPTDALRFTGLILAQMVEQKKVRLEEPVRALLPSGSVAAPASGPEITLVDLSTQHSGLPRLPDNFHPADANDPYADYDARTLLAFLGGRAAHAVAHPWNFEALVGCGGIRSTAADMLTYLDAQLHPGHLQATVRTSAEGKTLTAAIAASHVVRAEAWEAEHIALNWFRDETGSYWHSGATGGYTAFSLFNPEKDVAVVGLSNTAIGSNGNFTDDLGSHIVQRLTGRPAVSLAPAEASDPDAF